MTEEQVRAIVRDELHKAFDTKAIAEQIQKLFTRSVSPRFRPAIDEDRSVTTPANHGDECDAQSNS